MKIFGPDDNDALALLRDRINVVFVTGDKRGYPITHKRVVEDMGYRLELVSTVQRVPWLQKNYDLSEVIYMGDGIFDACVFRVVRYAIATADADESARREADYITARTGGNRALAEACFHILSTFFEPVDLDSFLKTNGKKVGSWST